MLFVDWPCRLGAVKCSSAHTATPVAALAIIIRKTLVLFFMNQPLENAGSSTFSSAPPLHSLRFGGESVEDTIHHRGKEIGEIAQRSKIKALMQISGKDSRAANPGRERCPLRRMCREKDAG